MDSSERSRRQLVQWGLIAFGILVFVLLVSVIVWKGYRKMNSNSSNTTPIHDLEKNAPVSPASADTIIVDEGIDVSKIKESSSHQQQQQEGTSSFYDGQQFSDVPHGLSPPKRSRKESSEVPQKPTKDEETKQESQDDLGKMRSVFSLSPPYYNHQQESNTSIHSIRSIHSMTPQSSSSLSINRHSSLGINSSNSRTNSPYNLTSYNATPSLIGRSMWRGPTPPWTQQYYSPPPAARQQKK